MTAISWLDVLTDKGVFAVSAETSPTALQVTIGKRFALLRKEAGITQKEMAEQLNVTQSMVSDYENGVFRLHGDLIVRIAKILKISTDKLLGLEKSKGDTGLKNTRLYKRLKEVDKLTKRDQDVLLRTIDAFLAKG